MMDWLTDTFIWTAALIVFVLLVRRPVARHFGPQAAYALWALPLIRLVLPPLTLPAWMAPVEPAVPAETALPPMDIMTIITNRPETAVVPTSEVVTAEPVIPFTLSEIALAIWMAGALTFIFLRFRAYRQMRQDLLAGGRDVGQSGKVRLVETPSTSAPLAFGVFDKVVALPEGFMANWDRDARDLALAHELAHHKGHDLAINMAVQPLFALHWFNPLGHLGWLALRRDQEAACDARVIAERASDDRATYAQVIASFAAGPNVALAAPMACPVLGDKSIIHRLRSLKMDNQSTKRRIAGRGLLAAALVALPLTATVTYAESSAFEEAFSDVAAPVAPEAPAAPAAPAAPLVPAAPLAPAAPAYPTVAAPVAVAAAPAFPVLIQAAPEVEEEIEKEENVWVTKDGERKIVIRKEVQEDIERDEEGREVSRTRVVRIDKDGKELSADEMRVIIREVKAGLDEADLAIYEALKDQKLAFADLEDIEGRFAVVEVNCESGGKGKKVTQDGEEVTVICQSEIMASALAGLREARKSLAENGEMSEEVLEEVLKALDEKIEQWEERKNN